MQLAKKSLMPLANMKAQISMHSYAVWSEQSLFVDIYNSIH